MTAASRIRVAHVITRMIVGGAQETALLAAALADRSRFDPVIVTGPQTGVEGSLHEQARERGVEMIIVPELVRQVAPPTDVFAVRALARLFRDLRPHVVHTNSSKAGITGRLAARRAGVPTVVHTVHGWPFHEHQPWAAGAMWRILERGTAPLADRIVVVAETDRAKGLAARVGKPEQYVTVRSGLEMAQYGPDAAAGAAVRAELGLPEDALVLGSIMRLSPQKDPLAMVRAARRTLVERPDGWLLIIGDGPLRGQAQELAASSGIGDRVIFAGLRTDVPRLLAAMDVFLSTSRYEGLPRTILQAMATNVPVVATSVDGIVEVVRDEQTGLLVPQGDDAAMSAAVWRLSGDAQLRSTLAARALQNLPEFDAGTMVRQLEALYAELVDGP